MPKTPGSRNEGEDIARIERPSSTGDPARTAALMRRERTHHEQAIAINPIAHIVHRTIGGGLVVVGGIAKDGDKTVGPVNGWLTLSITTEKLVGVAPRIVRK